MRRLRRSVSTLKDYCLVPLMVETNNKFRARNDLGNQNISLQDSQLSIFKRNIRNVVMCFCNKNKKHIFKLQISIYFIQIVIKFVENFLLALNTKFLGHYHLTICYMDIS